MVFVFISGRMNTVAEFKHVGRENFRERIQLASLLRFREITEFGGKIPQRHHNESGAVPPRTAGDAGHALPAIPDGLALEKLQYPLFVLSLDGIHYLSRIIFVELSRGADCSAGAAVYAGFQSLLEAVILCKFVIQFTHNTRLELSNIIKNQIINDYLCMLKHIGPCFHSCFASSP
jgi:hypothetical protein